MADVTNDGLLIRETNRKTRLVPLHDAAAAGLKTLSGASPAPFR
ncbi:hypothetical protein [Mesorhizobium sp. M0293]